MSDLTSKEQLAEILSDAHAIHCAAEVGMPCDCRVPDAIAELLRRAEPPSAWQPIETAPKGVALLVGYRNELGNWRTVIARYYLPGTLTAGDDDYDENVDEDGYAKEGWYEENEAYEFIRRTKEQPTHWTPLPSPPVTKEGRRDE